MKKKQTKKKLLRVVIKRKHHLRGNEQTSTMRNENGSMCCLGFVARALCIPVRHILNIPDPSDVANLHPEYAEKLRKIGLVTKPHTGEGRLNNNPYYNSATTNKLMTNNDTASCWFEGVSHSAQPKPMSPVEREKKICELGLKIGIRFVFE